MKITTESKIQGDCYKWFINNYGLKNSNPKCVMFSIPNEVAMSIRGALSGSVPEKVINSVIAVISQKLKNMGMLPGVSDTIIILPNKTLFVEFKTPDGRQQQNQIDFENDVKKLGHEYHIVKSLEDFKKLCSTQITH